jgi:hypothetical protein
MAGRVAATALRALAPTAVKAVRLADSVPRAVVDDIFACALRKQTGVSLKYMLDFGAHPLERQVRGEEGDGGWWRGDGRAKPVAPTPNSSSPPSSCSRPSSCTTSSPCAWRIASRNWKTCRTASRPRRTS